MRCTEKSTIYFNFAQLGVHTLVIIFWALTVDAMKRGTFEAPDCPFVKNSVTKYESGGFHCLSNDFSGAVIARFYPISTVSLSSFKRNLDMAYVR